MGRYIDPQRKLYQHLDRVAAFKAGQKPPPVNVEIDLSNRCSRGCHFCHFAYTHSRGPLAGKTAITQGAPMGTEGTGDLMTTDLAMQLVEDLEKVGVRSITWTGGGEPTLHPEFNKIIRATQIDQGLYTHGGHIDEGRAALLKQKCRWVYVSLDYVNAASYAASKGVGQRVFGESCAGVRRLVAAQGEATIGLGFLIGRDNHRQLWKMIELGRNLGVSYVQFRPVIYCENSSPGQVAEDRTWLDDDFFYRLKYVIRQTDVIVDESRFYMYRDWASHGYEVCWWSGLQTLITPDGRVWACLNKRGFAGAALGDLNWEPFAEIWERAPIQKVNGHCRVMCRGHVPNLILDPMMKEDGTHGNFI